MIMIMIALTLLPWLASTTVITTLYRQPY